MIQLPRNAIIIMSDLKTKKLIRISTDHNGKPTIYNNINNLK